MQFLKDIFHLFYPNLCVVCENRLTTSEKNMCTYCRHDLPIICYNDFEKNQVSQIFYGRIPIEKAAAFLLYQKEGKTKNIIHALKYHGNQEVGIFLGNWFGHSLKEKNFFKDIDYIIPVPLHQNKKKKRGYNQLTKFGKTLSTNSNVMYLENILIRTSAAKTQTFKTRFERFKNTNTKFQLTDNTFLSKKHILLIDDVITTGATLESCCKELLKTENIKISIATMAFTE
jgi:ComF family protein